MLVRGTRWAADLTSRGDHIDVWRAGAWAWRWTWNAAGVGVRELGSGCMTDDVRRALTATLRGIPVLEHVEGAPFQPGNRVHVFTCHIPETAMHVGVAGVVLSLLYWNWTRRQPRAFPSDPIIGVRLDTGPLECSLREEIVLHRRLREAGRARGSEGAS
jgi:hypothetical protein